LALVAQYELELDRLDLKTASLWQSWRGVLHFSADRIQNCRKEEYVYKM